MYSKNNLDLSKDKINNTFHHIILLTYILMFMIFGENLVIGIPFLYFMLYAYSIYNLFIYLLTL